MVANHAFLVHFKEVTTAGSFKKNFSARVLEVKYFLDWVIKEDISAAKSICEIVKKKNTCFNPLQKSMFARSPDPVLKEVGTERVWQILLPSLSVKTYGHKDQRIWQLFFRLFRKRHYPVTFLNSGQYLPSIQESTARRRSSIWTITIPSRFNALVFLHGISPISTSIFTKQLSFSPMYVTGRLIGYTV